MLPDMEKLKGLPRDEVIAEVKRCLEIYRKYSLDLSEEVMINMHLKDLGFEPDWKSDEQGKVIKASELTYEELENLAVEFLNSDSCEKLISQIEKKKEDGKSD